MSSFPESAKESLCSEFQRLCALCNEETTECGRHAAHILDKSRAGDAQVNQGFWFGLLQPPFSRKDIRNGLWLCPYCHLTLLTSVQRIRIPIPTSFFPALPVLNYLLKYYESNPETRMTVDQVLEDLHENPSNDPEAAAFIGLFRLLPAGAPGQSHTFSQAYAKATSRFPPPTILNTAWQWVDVSEPLPQNTQVYRIYDATKVDTSSVLAPGLIPLYDQQSQVYKGQLWRLHRSTGLLLTFLATHFQVGSYAKAHDGYQPPEECLKTFTLLYNLISPARASLYQGNQLPSVPEDQLPSVPEGHQIPKSISDCSSAYQNTSDEPDNLEKKEARPRKIDMSKVKAYVEEYLQSLKDVDFIVEPVDDLPSFDDLDTLAPHPALTPLAEDPDDDLPEWWMWGPSHSSKDAIELATNRHERNPCWMQKKNYSIENGTITFSDESRGTHPFRPSLFHY